MEKNSGGQKRKRKSFLKKARKYGKKGQFGRGTHISEETYQYFVRVLEIDRNGFDNVEEKKIFVENVFQQTVNEELNYSCNQLACRAIENLLPLASDGVILRFIKAFDKEIRVVCVDQFASHVLQKLIIVASERKLREPGGERPWLSKIALYLLNNIEEFVWDSYANHVVRTALQQVGSCASSQAELHSVVKRFSSVLSSLPQIRDYVEATLPSGLLQAALESLGEQIKPLIHRLLSEVFHNKEQQNAKEDVPVLLANQASCRLAESLAAAIAAHQPSSFSTLHDQLSRGRVVQISLHPTANFFVQRLLQHCCEPSCLEQIFDEISGRLCDIMATGHCGILLNLGQACQRLGVQQHRFMKEILQCFDCWEPVERQIKLAWQIATLRRFSDASLETKSKIQLHGSLLVQTLLTFKKPIKIVQSLLQMPESTLVQLFCDPCGSHVMDAFTNSSSVGEKSREKLAHKLKGAYMTLACSKHGSRALDALWEISSVKLREMIASELKNSRNKVVADNFGRGVWSRYALDTFCHRRSDWIAAQDGKKRVEKLFADILTVKPPKAVK